MIKEYSSVLKIETNTSTVQQLLSEICLLPGTLELETVNLESSKHLQILNGLLGILSYASGSNAASERHFSLLKRVKSFLRSTMSEKRSNSIAPAVINNDLIADENDVFNN